MSAPWITYRPEIKVLDATIRDGGLINDHQFDDRFVRAVYDTCIQAGIDYMEIGYKTSQKVAAPTKFGPWKSCSEDDLRRIIGEKSPAVKIAVMADAGGKTDYKTDILPKDQSIIDTVRVACYIHQIPEAVDMIKDAADKGYEATCNLMAISTVHEAEIAQALEVVATTPASTVVVVDSFGSLYQEQIRSLVHQYRTALEGTGKEIGIHAHNNQQLAFANTIEAIIHGANRIDATMGGLGRGAGNCPMELLLGFLRNPKFHLRPVWQLIQDHVVGLRREMEWGALAPYIITGQLNQHPRTAIAWLGSDQRDRCADFFDRCIAEV
ncbi:MAG: aldolase catalytic domain-containing protein [Polyangiaceae bacterium]|nr:aldolase catalytic domain-containing protein [Polyangiaceae bacterium]